MSEAPKGCGAPASRIVFRGAVRLFLCATCPYAGSGRVMPYETDARQEKKPGVYMGPARVCGQEVAAT